MCEVRKALLRRQRPRSTRTIFHVRENTPKLKNEKKKKKERSQDEDNHSQWHKAKNVDGREREREWNEQKHEIVNCCL